jgi:pimeloyl-ACP methyl ester carboxylesterase
MANMRRIRKSLAIFLLLLVAAGLTFYLRPLWVFGHYRSIVLFVEGVQSRKVVIDGHKVHYYVRGPLHGTPIVLIHGLGGRAEDWLHLAPYLVQAGYRVYTPDLLGFGQSDEPADATYSIPDQAKLVVEFFDALGLQQPDLAGWSMGGWVVQKVAADHPERVRRLILLDSAGLNMAPAWDTRLFTPTTPAELNQLDALLMPQPPVVPGFAAADILRSSSRSAWVIHRALASMLSGKDVMDTQLPKLRMPVLILWGDQDHITPLAEGRLIHTLIPQSRLEIAPGCGHLAPDQCSQLYGPELVRFLEANPPLPAGEQQLHGSA